MRRSTAYLWIIESRSRCVRICAEIVDVQILISSHHATVAVACGVEGAIVVTTDRATAVGKFSSCVSFVWLVQRVSVIVSCLFSTSADSCMIACSVLNNTLARAHRGEVPNVQRIVVTLSTHVAMNGLLPSVMASRMMMEPSLVELVGCNLIECVLVFSRSLPKVASVALMNWVACTSRCSLLPQLSLSNRL